MIEPTEKETIIEEINHTYNFDITDLKLLKQSENTTCLLTNRNNNRYILRINRPGYHSPDELNGETFWMQSLRTDTTLLLPDVYCNVMGNTVSAFSHPTSYGEDYSIFSYIAGADLQVNNFEECKVNIKKAGATAAILHNYTETHPSLMHLNRPSWSFDDLFGKNPRWGDWKAHHLLAEKEYELYQSTLDKIQNILNIFGQSSDKYGLIHADLHLSNFINSNNSLYLIDFDDCGYGWFLYECGCSLMQYNENIPQLCDAWLSGYLMHRQLQDEDYTILPSFIIMRRIARIAWMHSHAQSDTSESISDFQQYIDVTSDMCIDYIK